MAGEEPAEVKPRGALPAAVHTPRRTGKTVVDMSTMEKATQKVDLDLEVEDMSLKLGAKKQDPDDF